MSTLPTLAERIASLESSIQGSINYHEKQIQTYREKKAAAAALLTAHHDAIVKLRALGFEVEESSWSNYATIRTTRDRLTDVYKVVGRLDGSRVQKNIQPHDVNAKTAPVEVTLPVVNFEFLEVKYTVEVPRRPRKGQKCIVKKIRVPARTETRLVCNS